MWIAKYKVLLTKVVFFGRFDKNVKYKKTQGDQLLWEEPADGERGCGQDRGVGDEDRGDHGPRVFLF